MSQYRDYDVATCDYCREKFHPAIARPKARKPRGKPKVWPSDEDMDAFYASVAEADTARDLHVRAKHPTKYIAKRMDEIEREAKWMPFQGEDTRNWKTDPLAVEYRALMKEWWTLPADATQQAADLSPSRNRCLTTKGDMPADGIRQHDAGWLTRGKTKLLAKVRGSGQQLWLIDGTTYKFNTDIIQKVA